MTYTYSCNSCQRTWSEHRRIVDRDSPISCECGSADTFRQKVVPVQICALAAADWNNPYFNHGLGCEVKSDKHAREIAKARGLTEVGNEDPVKIQKKYEADRAKSLDYDLSSIMNVGEVSSK